MKVKLGDKFPNFELKDHDGNLFVLYDENKISFRVLYFYPKDETPGCTKQACYFRDFYEDFKKYECEIFGISNDTKKSHENFKENYKLPFKLLTDYKGKLRKQLNLPKDFFGLSPGRVTFLLNDEHEILFIFRSALNMKSHITSVLDFLKKNKTN
ncbi:MAG: peroxiredoxin [Bacteroidota bacterium]|nr:peroxiredoxin [Bacteroidota bacterium]